ERGHRHRRPAAALARPPRRCRRQPAQLAACRGARCQRRDRLDRWRGDGRRRCDRRPRGDPRRGHRGPDRRRAQHGCGRVRLGLDPARLGEVDPGHGGRRAGADAGDRAARARPDVPGEGALRRHRGPRRGRAHRARRPRRACRRRVRDRPGRAHQPLARRRRLDAGLHPRRPAATAGGRVRPRLAAPGPHGRRGRRRAGGGGCRVRPAGLQPPAPGGGPQRLGRPARDGGHLPHRRAGGHPARL
ncbi:MAG: Nodulin-related protein CC_0717, partial [uncultured Nocardioides sp.]